MEVDSKDRAWWSREEWAWPLAILFGFGGAWAGLSLGEPWLAVVLSAGLAVAFQNLLARRGAPEIPALSTLGWLVGVAGAAAGAVIDSDAPQWSASVNGDRGYRELIESWLAAGSSASGHRRWLHAGVFAGALTLARSTRGASGAAAAAFGSIALSTVAANLSLPDLRGGRSPLAVAACATPPHLALELAALAIGSAALATKPAAEPPLARRRRVIAASAVVVEIAVLAAWDPLGDAWGRWAAQHLAAR